MWAMDAGTRPPAAPAGRQGGKHRCRAGGGQGRGKAGPGCGGGGVQGQCREGSGEEKEQVFVEDDSLAC